MACIRKLFTKCNGFNPTPIVSPTAANKTTIIENSNANTGRYTLHSERSEYPKQNELNSSTSSPISTNNENPKISENEVEIIEKEQEQLQQNNDSTTNSIVDNTNQNNNSDSNNSNNNNNINNLDDNAILEFSEQTNNVQQEFLDSNCNNKKDIETELSEDKLNNNEIISQGLSTNDDVTLNEPEEEQKQKQKDVFNENKKQFLVSDHETKNFKTLNAKAIVNDCNENVLITVTPTTERKRSSELNENNILNKILKFEHMNRTCSVNATQTLPTKNNPSAKEKPIKVTSTKNNQTVSNNIRYDSKTNKNKILKTPPITITKPKPPDLNSTIGKYSLELTNELRKQELFVAKQKENKKQDKGERHKQQAIVMPYNDKNFNNPLAHNKRHKQNYLNRQQNRPHQQRHLLNPNGFMSQQDIEYYDYYKRQQQKLKYEKEQKDQLDVSLFSNTNLIGNEEYEEARRNRQPIQYTSASKITNAVPYLEELKMKQKQHIRQQHQLLLNTYNVHNMPLKSKNEKIENYEKRKETSNPIKQTKATAPLAPRTICSRDFDKNKDKNLKNNFIPKNMAALDSNYSNSDDDYYVDPFLKMKLLNKEKIPMEKTDNFKNIPQLIQNPDRICPNYNSKKTIKKSGNRELFQLFNSKDVYLSDKDVKAAKNVEKFVNNIEKNKFFTTNQNGDSKTPNLTVKHKTKQSNPTFDPTNIRNNNDYINEPSNNSYITTDEDEISSELEIFAGNPKRNLHGSANKCKPNYGYSEEDINRIDVVSNYYEEDNSHYYNYNSNDNNIYQTNYDCNNSCYESNSKQNREVVQRKNNGKNGSHGRDSGVQVDEPENQHKHHQQHQQLDITKIKQSSDDSSSGNGNNRSISSNSNRTDTGRSSNTPQDSRGKTSILNPEESDENLRKGLIFHRRSDNKEAIDIPIFEKDKEIRTLITKAIEKNDFLNNYMDKERKKRVIDAMEPEFYDKGEFIIKENEEGSEIYVSEMGEFEVIKNNKILTTLGPGIVFGELAILYNAKRFASIRAKTKAKVWKIDRTKFRTIMLISGSEERKENLKFLKSAPFLEELSDEVLLRVCELLKRKFFPTDTRIIRQGDKGDLFFIIRGGSVTIKKTDENGQERIVDRRKREQYFGEQALLNCDQRLASVYADPPGTECLILDREAFINYLGTIAELKKKPKDRDIQPDIKIPSSQFDFIKLKDLKKVTCLGAGAFGVVDLVTYNEKFSFALKVIKKIDVIKQGQIDHIYNEKLVMSICRNSPFIIELYNTFRDTKYVYFLMEACLGGDVWTIMYQRKFFDEKTARFISGCVVEAFDFLHTRNIIYRDLKPENLMVTPDGYCKLVDFGFAKRLVTSSKTNTFAGTPEYVAPEIILDRGHDRAVDYWALGILIYELLAGRTPFRGTNQMKIYQQILTGIDAVKMSAKITKHAQNLIKSLCKQTPAERLGYQRRGILDIKKHSWYDGFDWNKLRNRQMSSPIKRPINSYIDTQYFPTKFENDGSDPPVEMSGWDDEF